MAKPPVNWNNVSGLTPGMKNLGNQFNARWPGRYGDSDGAWGDYEHTQGKSGHNPDDTSHHNAEWDGDSDTKQEVRAIDVDTTLNDPEINMQMVIDHMRKLPNLKTVIRYMIYNRKIYNQPDFQPENYSGASAHTEHAHFSGAYSDASDENKTFDFKFDELGDNVTEEQFMDWSEKFNAKTSVGFATWQINGIGGAAPSYQVLADTAGRTNIIMSDGKSALSSLASLTQAVADLTAKVDALTEDLEAHFSGLLEGEETPKR